MTRCVQEVGRHRFTRCSYFVKLIPKGEQPVSIQQVVTIRGVRMGHTPCARCIYLGFDSEVSCRFVNYINDTI